MDTRLPSPQLQQAIRAELARLLRGKAEGETRVTVCFVRCSTATSDYGNLVGSYKALLDQLRDSGAIANDDPKTIWETYGQVKVSKLKERGTAIRIEITE